MKCEMGIYFNASFSIAFRIVIYVFFVCKFIAVCCVSLSIVDVQYLQNVDVIVC